MMELRTWTRGKEAGLAAALPGLWKGGFVVLYDEPECSKFIAAVQRLKERQRRTHRQSRLVRQRVRAVLASSAASITPEGEPSSAHPKASA
jgi:hypothetical protein